jgi:hypothetical protein
MVRQDYSSVDFVYSRKSKITSCAPEKMDGKLSDTQKNHAFNSEIIVEQVTFGTHVKALNLSGRFYLCVKLSQYKLCMFSSKVSIIMSVKARYVKSCPIFLL